MKKHKKLFKIFVCMVFFFETIRVINYLPSSDGFRYELELLMLRESGLIALFFLVASYSVSTLMHLSPVIKIPGECFWWRRSLGILSAIFGIMHAIMGIAFRYSNLKSQNIIKYWHSRSGIIATFILLLLLLTSWPIVNKKMGLKVWSELHFMIHPAILFVLIHIFYSSFGSIKLLIYSAIYIGVLLLVRVGSWILRQGVKT